jgi:hypothetical protein
MDRKKLHVQWNVLFCVLLFVMMTSAVALAESPENAPGTGASESDEINFLTISLADIRANAEGLLNPGVLVITKKEYEKNYQDMLKNRGFGGIILDAGDRAIAESGIGSKGQELGKKYDPAKSDAGNFFDPTNGIEDTLVGSWFDPSVDSTGNLVASLTDSLNPTSAKGTGGTIISSQKGSKGNKGRNNINLWFCLSDTLTPAEIGPQGDRCTVVTITPNGMSAEDEKSMQEWVDFQDSMNAQKNEADRAPVKIWVETDNYKGWGWYQEGTTWWGNGWGKNKAPGDDDGTGASDPNTAGYSISGIFIEQKDNLDQVANDGGASSKINQKYKWLIDASKQPGFFVPGSGGYDVGDAGLGGDVGIVTYDRTGLPRINTEKKIPWYLQPMALPKDMGYASEVAAASEGESRTYEFSSENMMASSEAMGGLKAGDAVKNNVAGGGVVRGP